MGIVLLLFLVAVSPLVYGRLTRPPPRATAAGGPQARRDLIRLTLTPTEARMFRALIVLGSRAMWPDHVRHGVERAHRKELERLARSVPAEQLLDTATFYWIQLSSWLRDRARPGRAPRAGWSNEGPRCHTPVP